MKKSIDTLTVTDFLRALYYPMCKGIYEEAERQGKILSSEFIECYESLKEFEEYSITPIETVNYVERITGNYDHYKMSLLDISREDLEPFEEVIFNELLRLDFSDDAEFEYRIHLVNGLSYNEVNSIYSKTHCYDYVGVSEEIIPYLKRLQENGYLDEYYKIKDGVKFTRTQQHLFALCCNIEVGSQQGDKSYYSELEELWETRCLKTYKFETANIDGLNYILNFFEKETRDLVTKRYLFG